MYIPFKNRSSFQDRYMDATNIKLKYPDRIPVICERLKNAKNDCPLIDKNKYLVPMDLTLGQFIYVIRKRLSIGPDKGLFLFIGNNIVSTSVLLCELYHLYKDEDNFLYINYSFENTFGL